jgi:oxygen-independent coproporphyrinogen-3 oxidase
MDLFIISHPFRFETENIVRMFFKSEDIKILFEDKISDSYIKTIAEDLENGQVKFTVDISLNGKKFSESVIIDRTENYKKEGEYALMRLLYKSLQKFTGYSSVWGMLTGIRPSKFYRNTKIRVGDENIDKYFQDTYLLSDEKLALTREVANREDEILKKVKDFGCSLYISIPFCPTRCLYCSFVSHSIERTRKLMIPYVKNLAEELKIIAKIIRDLDLPLQSIYFGGGTPTSLENDEIDFLMKTVRDNFNLSELIEYTVEAGRPDTVTEEKLKTILNYGATRISINPQTASDDVLKIIGRNHTFSDFCEKFSLARKIGFNNINTDLIAGLPGDNLDGFKNSIDRILEKNPENVTVHTLAIKRSSTLGEHPIPHSGEVDDMLKYASLNLREAGLNPYYMYRQSNSASDLENVGYAKSGFEGFYNIVMMNEVQSVFSAGAGAVTKLKNPKGGEIERIFNYKFPYEYLDRFDDILNRKGEILKFYGKFI